MTNTYDESGLNPVYRCLCDLLAQIQFIDHIVMPVYQLLWRLQPSAEPPFRAVQQNKQHWTALKNILEARGAREHMDVMDIFKVIFVTLHLKLKRYLQDKELEKMVLNYQEKL